jgi:hypothetical protein
MTMQQNITRRLASGQLSSNKATGAVIWLVGAWLTAQALGQLGVPYPFSVAFGLAIQWALTRAESPLWRGKGYLKNLGQTDFWQMVRDVTGQPQSQPTIVTIVMLALVVGAFTAAAAEYFWNLEG